VDSASSLHRAAFSRQASEQRVFGIPAIDVVLLDAEIQRENLTRVIAVSGRRKGNSGPEAGLEGNQLGIRAY
jgi:hypothetical protein